MDDDENLQCCGSGCSNCVLDRELNMPKTAKEGCVNVINQVYTKFKLTSIERCTINTYQLTFTWHNESLSDVPTQKKRILVIPGGSYLMLRSPKNLEDPNRNPVYEDYRKKMQEIPRNINFQDKFIQKHDTTEEDLFISRPYTPVFVDEDNCQFTILLKLEPFGRMSEYIQTLHVNAVTEWKGVYNNIPTTIKTSSFSHVICFSHGVSIAPFYTLFKELTEDDTFESNIHLYACFKDITTILLRDKLIQLNGYWNFKSTIVLSGERHVVGCDGRIDCDCVKACQRFNEKLVLGRIDKDFIRSSIQSLEEKTLVLLCGSESFTSQIQVHLQDNKNIEIHIL